MCVCITFSCTAVYLAPGFYIGSVNYSEESHLNRSGLDPLQNMAFDRRKKLDLFSLFFKDQARFDLCLYITRFLFHSFLLSVSSMLPLPKCSDRFNLPWVVLLMAVCSILSMQFPCKIPHQFSFS